MNIEKIVSLYDAQTKCYLAHKDASLVVDGDDKSPFIRAIKKKCDALDVKWLYPEDGLAHPVVVDLDVSYPDWLEEKRDIDCIVNDGISCCAEAVLSIIAVRDDGISGCNVCIIGRGHAVKGLADALLTNGATVTLCHSKTRDVMWPVTGADVVVLASPVMPNGYDGSANYKTIDVSGLLGDEVAVTASEVGKLNVSVLLNRLAKTPTLDATPVVNGR